MILTITPIYAAILCLLYLGLSTRVIIYRRANRVSLGGEDNHDLLQRIRAQGNCAEYAPLGIILILIAELQGAPGLALHLLGLTLLAGRLLHGYAFTTIPMNLKLRVLGMAMTLGMLGVTAIGLLLHAIV